MSTCAAVISDDEGANLDSDDDFDLNPNPDSQAQAPPPSRATTSHDLAPRPTLTEMQQQQPGSAAQHRAATSSRTALPPMPPTAAAPHTATVATAPQGGSVPGTLLMWSMLGILLL